MAASLLAATEDLVGQRDDAVDGNGSTHPVIPAAVLKRREIKSRCRPLVSPVVEASVRCGHLETLMGSFSVVARDPFVELSLCALDRGKCPCS